MPFGLAGMLLAATVSANLAALLDRALAAPTFRGAHVGTIVMRADTHETLYERDADDDFAPASTFKLIVGSAALARLGAEATLRTDLFTDGTIDDGTLHGNLYLRGGGDGTLAERDLDDAATSLAGLGIT